VGETACEKCRAADRFKPDAHKLFPGEINPVSPIERGLERWTTEKCTANPEGAAKFVLAEGAFELPVLLTDDLKQTPKLIMVRHDATAVR
jgi:hypothetical protein